MTELAPGARPLALKLGGVAPDAAALRDVLDALGLLAQPAPQPKPVRPHAKHTRSVYVPGCARCREANRRYVQQWRARRTRPAVTPAATMKPQQLTLWS